MSNKKYIRGPREALWILRATDEKSSPAKRPRRFNQKSFKSWLTVAGVGAEVRKIGPILLTRSNRKMSGGIDAAIKRRDKASAQAFDEFG